MVELVDTHDLPAGRQAQNRVNILQEMYFIYVISSIFRNYIYVGISDNDLEYGEVFNIKDKSYVDLDDSETSIIYQDQ